MKSPFAIFRKHQKVLTVLLTGMAMFAFVILGAVNDPSHMTPMLMVVVLACVFGGIGWVMGIRSQKMSEFGTVGLVIGAVLGAGATMLNGPPVLVKADTGNLNVENLSILQSQRNIANQFIMQAVLRARQNAGNAYVQQPAPFGFGEEGERDLVIGELLRREARDLGIEVPDAMVSDYISAITQQNIGAGDVEEIDRQMRISESALYDSLRAEIQARLALGYLYDNTRLPPETYWDFYRQMNLRQTVAIAPIPVSAFVDPTAEPTESELQQFFDAHRNNFPDLSDDGRLDEGRSGFRQPRKVRLAYVEAVYDDVEKTVEPPTDAEVEAFYNEGLKALPAGHTGGSASGKTDAGTQENAAPADGDAGASLPGPPEKLPEGTTDGEDSPASAEPPAGDNAPPATTPPAAPTEDGNSDSSDDGASRTPPSATKYVALLDDEAAADQPAADTRPAETQPATADPKPVADEAAGTVDQPAAESPLPATPPPPPLPEATGEQPAAAAPVLDDNRRSEIRDQILRERTEDKLKHVVKEVQEFMRDLEIRISNLPEDKEYLTPAQALQELRAFAEKKGLVYAETPPLSVEQLLDSEEYPIGSAVQELFADPFNPQASSSVVQQLFTSAPRERYRSQAVIQPDTESRFVYWKTDDQAELVPESLSAPGVRQQVLTAWRELRAREKAESRAKELAKSAEAADKPLSEVFAGQTVTGQPGAAAVSVLHPPRFSWMSKADPRLSPNPWSTPPPERTRLRNVPGRIGDSFMQTVFDDLQVGEVGIAHSIDKDYFYVVRVDDRTYERAVDLQAFRDKFLREQIFVAFSDYPKLAEGKLQSYQTDWREALLKKHGVEFVKRDQKPARGEEQEAAPAPASIY